MLRHAIVKWIVVGCVASFAAPSLAEQAERPAPGERPAKPGKGKPGKDKSGKAKPGKGKNKRSQDLQEKRKERLQRQADHLEKRAAKLREQGKDKQADALEKRAALAKERAERVGDGTKSPKAERRQRKLKRIKHLKRKYGKQLGQPPVRQELRLHAKRMARLNRMKTLAQANEKTELVERIDKMIEKENERHESKMQALIQKQGQAPEGEAPEGKAPKAEPAKEGE